jgi:phage gpG-like protein
MKIVMELHGETQLNRRFMRWSGFAGDLTPAWESIYAYLLKVEKKQFSSEGAMSGHDWAELAESTVKNKQRLGLRPEILRATDALLNSLTSPDDANQLKIIQPNMLAFGSMMPYAKLHQSGTSKMPQRRPIDLTLQNKVAILKTLQLFLARGVVAKMAAP